MGKKLTYLKQLNCLHRANVSYHSVTDHLLEANVRQMGNLFCRLLNWGGVGHTVIDRPWPIWIWLETDWYETLRRTEYIFRYEERIKHLFTRITDFYSFESQEICIHLKFIIKWMQKNIQIEKLSFYSPQEYSNKKIAFFLFGGIWTEKLIFPFQATSLWRKFISPLQ